jgi:hypothetical protein
MELVNSGTSVDSGLRFPPMWKLFFSEDFCLYFLRQREFRTRLTATDGIGNPLSLTAARAYCLPNIGHYSSYKFRNSFLIVPLGLILHRL